MNFVEVFTITYRQEYAARPDQDCAGRTLLSKMADSQRMTTLWRHRQTLQRERYGSSVEPCFYETSLDQPYPRSEATRTCLQK